MRHEKNLWKKDVNHLNGFDEIACICWWEVIPLCLLDITISSRSEINKRNVQQIETWVATDDLGRNNHSYKIYNSLKRTRTKQKRKQQQLLMQIKRQIHMMENKCYPVSPSQAGTAKNEKKKGHNVVHPKDGEKREQNPTFKSCPEKSFSTFSWFFLIFISAMCYSAVASLRPA